MAFETTERGTYNPQRLSALHKRCAGSSDPAERLAAEEALQAFGAVDWTRASAFTDLLWLSGPWGFDHRASVHMFGTRGTGFRAGPTSRVHSANTRGRSRRAPSCTCSGTELHGHRPLRRGNGRLHCRGRSASLVHGQKLVHFAMGPAACLRDGSRSGHDPTSRGRHGEERLRGVRIPKERGLPPAGHSSLLRAPGPHSSVQAAPLFRNVARRIAGEWRDGRARRRGARGNCWPAVADGRLHLPWGVCLIGRDRGRIIVRRARTRSNTMDAPSGWRWT